MSKRELSKRELSKRELSKKESGAFWLVPAGAVFVFALLLFVSGDKENDQHIDTISIQINQ